MAGPIRISILADGSQASRAFSSTSRSAGSMGESFKKAGKVAALGVAAAAAGAVAVGKSLVEAGERAGTSNARISQVADSMGLFGDQADKVSGRLIKLAESQARATGVDQNAIKATQAKLLTFGELAETADKVGGNFDRATAAAVDLAAAGFGSAESNAVQLGKALNDPIKGLASLAKSGVTFTDAEKERISTLVESNKMGEAQSLVLAAIEKQVGGTAVATANGTDKIKVAFSQLAERLGGVLVPMVDRFATFIVDKALPAAKRLADDLRDRLAPVFATIRDAVGSLMDRLQPLADWLASNPVLIKGAAIALGAAAVAATALGVAFGVIAVATSPITLTIAAIAALGAGIAYAYKNSETFRNAVQGLADKFAEFQPQVEQVWGSVRSAIGDALAAIRQIIVSVTAAVQAVWKNFGDQILSFITTTMKNMQTVLKGAFDIISGLFKAVKAALTGDWKGLWDAIKQIVSGALQIVKGTISQAWNVIKTATSAAWELIKAAVGKAWDGIKDLVSTGIDKVVGFVKDLPGRITSVVSGAFDGLKEAFRSAVNFIIDGWNGLSFSIPGFDPPGPGPKFAGFTLGVPNIPRLARGGVTTGPTLALVGDNPGGREAVIPLDRYDLTGGAQLVPLLEQLIDVVKAQTKSQRADTQSLAGVVRQSNREAADDFGRRINGAASRGQQMRRPL